MKHKHKWQFVRNYELVKYGKGKDDYIELTMSRENKEIFKEVKEYAEFICECGKVRVVEVKR